MADATITAVDGTTGAATIEFTVVDGTADNTVCTLVYPAKLSDGTTTVYNDAKTGVKDAATLLSAQDGTLNANLDVRVGAGTIQTTTPSLTVTTQPEAQFAIFKFTLSGVSIDNTHPLVIKDNASNTTITTVKPASTATSVFVAMPAAASKTYKFVVATADNKYIKSGTATIAAGNYYQTTLSMTTPRYPLALSNATADDLGAVVNSEGQMSVEKAAASGTAVGIVGKVTETGHGLILALHDATAQTWNTINGWTSTTTYASTTLKVLPDDAARGANLTSYTALGTTAVSNWAVAQKSDYEAIFQTLGSTEGDGDGTTYDGNVNAYITTGVGGAAISGDYWSATEYDGDAWDFFSDFWDYSDKEESYSVRPVLGFGGDAAPATDLSTITTDYVAKNGETLTGTLGSNVKISIADGATVTLNNVTINGTNDSNYEWAGITCLGDATIILSGTNTVNGFYGVYPGIQAAAGKTLTINGAGSLTASSYGKGAGIGGGNNVACGNIEIQGGTITATGGQYGAGIGGGDRADCGNITISGGTVYATGGERGAGIGGGRRGPTSGSCGNIIISGGTVTATGGENAAGIGGGRGYNAGNLSSCGTITITSGVTKVTATKGDGAPNSIGAGKYGTCGTVTIEAGANVTQN